ncbi:hypothetical protein [Streptomyces decoyicus]|uniref:hypothetical protein n=1 Tax=Streptomyces decoyicus TaxID=249567 RepID=UPI0033B23D40
MRARLAVTSVVTALAGALAVPVAAQAQPASSQSATSVTPARWEAHSGPYSSLSSCQMMAEYHGYNSKNSYCNQLQMGRWYLIVWR